MKIYQFIYQKSSILLIDDLYEHYIWQKFLGDITFY